MGENVVCYSGCSLADVKYHYEYDSSVAQSVVEQYKGPCLVYSLSTVKIYFASKECKKKHLQRTNVFIMP